jgi:hypothetical protein
MHTRTLAHGVHQSSATVQHQYQQVIYLAVSTSLNHQLVVLDLGKVHQGSSHLAYMVLPCVIVYIVYI